MNSNYKFVDLIGSSYRSGPVLFLPDGFTLICANGNRLKYFDLKRNTSFTSDVQLRFNIVEFDVNSKGSHAMVAERGGTCYLINLRNDVEINRSKFHNEVKALKFSPDSRYLAVGVSGFVKIFSVADMSKRQFTPLSLLNNFKHSEHDITGICWSLDGRLVAAASEQKTIKVFSAVRAAFSNIGCVTLGERAPLVSLWFLNNNYGILSVDRSGIASVWDCSHRPDQLILAESQKTHRETLEKEQNSGDFDTTSLVRFSKNIRASLSTKAFENDPSVNIISASFNKLKMLLAVGFSNGVFCIFDVPAFEMLQNFRVGEKKIGSIRFNSCGDWLAVGSGQGREAQLLVWEWKSESYILRQQSHSQMIRVAMYSPDGSVLATGAEDGKVKLWNCTTAFCTVTFTEHESGVTDICFTQSGKVILSASLEGSIRAHDLKRYRNFRTIVAPKQTQLHLLCADSTGDIVAAASRDQFEIYIWAFETGQLLDVLTGHSDLISGLACFENMLCSVSLDKTMRIWNIVEAGNCLETVQLLNEGLDLKYSPNGALLAVLCYDSNIILFDTRNTGQLGTIETKLDIDAGRERYDKLKKASSQKNKTFTCIAFSPTGQLLLAGGQSNIFCLYSVPDRIKIRSFKLSSNYSFAGTSLDIDYRKMTEFGKLDLFDLSDSEEEETNPQKKIRLPGTRHTDLSERSVKPSISVAKISFSPNGLDFAIAYTEGVCVYSLARVRRFDPVELELNVTPKEIVHQSDIGEHAKALTLALKLKEAAIIERVVEAISIGKLDATIRSIGFNFAEYLLTWIAANKTGGPMPSRHFHFYLLLIKKLLYTYSTEFKRSLEWNRPALLAVTQLLASQNSLLMNMCDQNVHSMEYLIISAGNEE